MYSQLCSWENLLVAYRKASKGKRGQPNVAGFEYHLEDNLLQLQRELREKTYQPGGYLSFYIHDPKKRLISAAPFRDRVLHHALCQVIEPIRNEGLSMIPMLTVCLEMLNRFWGWGRDGERAGEGVEEQRREGSDLGLDLGLQGFEFLPGCH